MLSLGKKCRLFHGVFVYPFPVDINSLSIADVFIIKAVILVICNFNCIHTIKVDNGILTVYYIIIIDRILYSNGVIVVKWGNEEIPCYAAWTLENEELNIKCYVRHSAGDPEKGYYKAINFHNLSETSISKDEYYSLYNKYIGDAKAVDIDWKRIDEYGN